MTNGTGLLTRVVGVLFVCAALAGCRWTSIDLLLRADLAARPFEPGFYALREDEEDTPEIGYFDLLADGWYRMAEDRNTTPDDTYLMLEPLDAGEAPGLYVGAWTDATCARNACAEDRDFTYMLLAFDGKVLSSYMPDCDKAEDGAFSPDRRAALGPGRATIRAEGSREVCVFENRDELFAAMRDVAARFVAGSLDGASRTTLQRIE